MDPGHLSNAIIASSRRAVGQGGDVPLDELADAAPALSELRPPANCEANWPTMLTTWAATVDRAPHRHAAPIHSARYATIPRSPTGRGQLMQCRLDQHPWHG
jgi:hypothetical protein